MLATLIHKFSIIRNQSDTVTQIGINGFGRIGRIVFRNA